MPSDPHHLLFPALLFVTGFVAGYLTALWAVSRTQREFRHAIALLVTLIWALSWIVSIVVPSYSTSVAIHAAMGAVTGYLFAGEDGIKLLPSVKR